ncbi:E3 ubiquitin-protein ligase TRIM71-like [Saccostrea echinata]|uniref:E3 ubiquitin-protein ligase TRIM71-like n=1 Tax=Saccostrea echinata TaxID=191078 RepID=UPI002A7F4BB0|nr:E3 ubiquitin-protein ligase TRIM71-like [Saccostrea echinata]
MTDREALEEVRMQSAVVCDTCENTAEYLCKTCHDKLCTRCKDIHSRSKSSFDHEVTQLMFESLSQLSEFPSIQVCRYHPGFRANICCRECEVPVCEKCLVDDHNGHKLVATKILFLEKKEKIENKFSFVESELPKYDAKLAAIKERQASQVERTKIVKSKINSHFEEVKSKLEEEKNRLLETVNVKEESEISELQIQESQMLEYIKNIHSFMTDFRNAIPAERNRFILYANPSIKSTVPEIFPCLPTPGKPQFSKGSLDETAITNLCGKIYLQRDGLQLQANFLEVEEIIAGSKKIEGLSFQSNDDTFWVYFEGDKVFTKIDRVGNDLFKIKGSSANNKPICTSPDGDVYFRTHPNVISKLSPDREETIFVDFSDQSTLPICMYFLKDEECIAIGVINAEVTKGKILRYRRRGQLIDEIKSPLLFRCLVQAYKGDQKIEQTYVAGNINGDICISNRFVDVFDKDGELKFSYTGSRKTGNTFLSGGICTDILGQILIADKTSHCIHVLNIEGKLLKLMDVPRLERKSYPITLTIDANYCVCVGCSDGRIKVLKYIE